MTGFKKCAVGAASLTALTTVATLAFAGASFADTLQDTIDDGGTGVSLEAGSAASGSATIRVVGNNAAGDPDPGCNIDNGEAPLRLDIVTPAGVTATPDPLSITSCGTAFTVSFEAAADAVSGHATVAVLSGPAGGGTYQNHVDIPITITQPAPVNTAPSVSVSGVTPGAEYVVGAVPAATCEVTDAEDGDSSFPATLTTLPASGLGTQTAGCDYTDEGGLSDTDSVTYSVVPPPNTQPTVAVTGVSDGGVYEIGSEPSPVCEVTDLEDGDSTVPALVTGTLSHGLGTLTASCDYTDGGGLSADTATATYTIVDTGDPTIGHSLSPIGGPNANGWYREDVTVSFECADVGGSGVSTCEGDATLGEGADQTVTGTATDWAGNSATDTVSGINIDSTDPVVGFVGGPTDGASYYFGSVPAAPTCSAADALSGLDGTCEVSGGGAVVGTHSYTVSATDRAGNTATATLSYTVLAWTTKGYFAPVDMLGVWNVVKGGSTVPLKFELFAGPTELTSTSAVKTFTQRTVACPNASATVDEIELVTTGGTSLRYDATGGQFVQNWSTPKKPGTCYQAIMTAQDGSTISANFILK